MYVCKQTFQISRVRISQKAKGVIMRNLRNVVFYVKTKILTDFHICISLPLRNLQTSLENNSGILRIKLLNFQGIVFIRPQTYREILQFALVYL